jgi:hypothetical protein
MIKTDASDIATGPTLLTVENLNPKTICKLTDKDLQARPTTKICMYMSHLLNKAELRYEVCKKKTAQHILSDQKI